MRQHDLRNKPLKLNGSTPPEATPHAGRGVARRAMIRCGRIERTVAQSAIPPAATQRVPPRWAFHHWATERRPRATGRIRTGYPDPETPRDLTHSRKHTKAKESANPHSSAKYKIYNMQNSWRRHVEAHFVTRTCHRHGRRAAVKGSRAPRRSFPCGLPRVACGVPQCVGSAHRIPSGKSDLAHRRQTGTSETNRART